MTIKQLTLAIPFVLPILSVPLSAEVSYLYSVTNKTDSNSVAVFARQEGGQFKLATEVSTGGVGTGDLEIPALMKDETHPLANGDDPLISANTIVMTQNGKHLVVVNPGDSTISLMSLGESGIPVAVNTAKASDLFPVSLASHGKYIVAASVGADNNNGSISLYEITNAQIVAVEGSRRDLKARPSTIGFSSDGKHVIVNELVTGKIKVFGIENGMLTGEPVSSINSPRDAMNRFQAIPVGFAIRGDGNNDIIAMSEARFLTPDYKLRAGSGEVVQSPKYTWQTGSVSTYNLTDDGQISLISGDVLTGSGIEGGEIANCWVAFSPDGKTLWAANALSSSISTLRIRGNGTASLVNDVAYKDQSETLFFSDMAVGNAGKELFQLVGNKGEVMIFDISEYGDLSLKQTVGGLPKLGSYGILAK